MCNMRGKNRLNKQAPSTKSVVFSFFFSFLNEKIVFTMKNENEKQKKKNLKFVHDNGM